jgi:hypothetical protein
MYVQWGIWLRRMGGILGKIEVVMAQKTPRERLSELLQQGEAYVYRLWQTSDFPRQGELLGWMGATVRAIHAVTGPLDRYRFEVLDARIDVGGRGMAQQVDQMAALLGRVIEDFDAGLLLPPEMRGVVQTFEQFLDHARAYHKQGKKQEAGVITGVVFEDTIRRIAALHHVSQTRLDQVVTELANRGVLTDAAAKRARAAAAVRNGAAHANWVAYDIKDVGPAIDLTQELIEHLDSSKRGTAG